MLPSIDATIHPRTRPTRLGSFLDILCFWGDGPTLGAVEGVGGRLGDVNSIDCPFPTPTNSIAQISQLSICTSG